MTRDTSRPGRAERKKHHIRCGVLNVYGILKKAKRKMKRLQIDKGPAKAELS